MWKDLGVCTLTKEATYKNLIQKINDVKLAFSSRIKYIGLLTAFDAINDQLCAPLRVVWNAYADACVREYLYRWWSAKKSKDSENFDTWFINSKDKMINDKNVVPKKYVYTSSSARDFFMMNLPVLTIYKPSPDGPQAYLTARLNGVDWAKVVSLEWPQECKLFNETVSKKLEGIMKDALSYISTNKDRQLFKLVLAKLTSPTFMSKGIGGVQFNKQKTRDIVTEGLSNLDAWRSLNDGTLSKTQARQKRESLPIRLEGSGRPAIASLYPDLASLMLSLFDSQGSGLQSHPRLICDVLYQDKTKSFMNMTRCVSILNQIYGIPISVSTAYTYTDNYRAKSKQAMRHHEGKGINAKISLKASTRDGEFERSIDTHFALADLQYTLNNALAFSHSGVIARDDKSRVHTDVEPVQRPSKSWTKINYADHDWAKDTRRTLIVTTYQFVHLSKISEEEIALSSVGGIPVCRTRVTGPGEAIVKIGFFEPSTIWRHMNETLFVLSQEINKHHFISDNRFVSQLFITVDGGGDERPRNRKTKFVTTLMRWVLDLDKLKVQSLAAGDSKFHSVERVHPSENRALSMGGVISSKQIHSDETDNCGLHDEEKFHSNMEMARTEAIDRISGAFHAGEVLHSCSPPSESNWVFPPEVEVQVDELLKNDNPQWRLEHNFRLEPTGPIWERLCEMYDLSNRNRQAVYIFNAAFDPLNSWHQHYAFASYREDKSWRGPDPVRKFELQPIVDIGRLPEHHYLPYSQVLAITEAFENEGSLPEFLTTPDFFLPRLNIENLMKKNAKCLEDVSDLETLSDLIATPVNKIKTYIINEKEKARRSKKQKAIVKEYKKQKIGKLSNAQLNCALKLLSVSIATRNIKRAQLLVKVNSALKAQGLSQSELLKRLKVK